MYISSDKYLLFVFFVFNCDGFFINMGLTSWVLKNPHISNTCAQVLIKFGCHFAFFVYARDSKQSSEESLKLDTFEICSSVVLMR
jgi:hypothetical protein